MFKKALQIAVSLGFLIGGYAGYTRLFALVVALVGDGRGDGFIPFPEVDSASAQRANELARESFGPTYWASRKDLKLQYYEASRGYYLYAENYERLKEGKRLHVWPFAEISVSPDGKVHKMITSDEAVIDFSQPLGLVSKPGTEPSHIVHAKLLGDVRIRDDKGTREDLTDDLRIGPMTMVDYDDKTLQITSDSDIILQDRDLRLTGIGMMLQLRRKVVPPELAGSGGGGSGFETETAFVYKDVHIIVNNVGSNGILPGTAKPEKTGKTPLDLRCDREMRIDFPRARTPVAVGPEDLERAPDPTYAKFKTNVRVERGTEKLDRLNCDTLDLTLMPNPRPPEASEDEDEDEEAEDAPTMVATVTTPPDEGSEPEEPKAAPASTGGPLTDLKLRKAIARGDAVWLQSEASGMVARCHELHYEKHVEEGTPDVTYLNGGLTKKLWVEKVDYDSQAPTPGTIKSIMRLTSIDATILDFGPGGTSKIIARGPGKTEERPARNASVARTGFFEDEMRTLTWRDGEATMPEAGPDEIRALKYPRPPIAKGTLRRLVTMTGISKLVDHNSSTTLDARKSIVAEFQAATGCDVQLIAPAVNRTSMASPSKGKNLIVVAALDQVLHFRIFDGDGRMVEDTDEKKLASQGRQIGDLRTLLDRMWAPYELTRADKGQVVAAVTSFVGQAPGRTLPDAKDGPTEIKWLDGYEDAHLTAPSRTLTARQFLKVKFETRPKPPTPTPAPASSVASTPAPPSATGPVVASTEANPTPTPVDEQPESPLAPPEPAVDGRADRVWASVLLGGEPNSKDSKAAKGELKDAQLRGGVMVHQEPQPGKALGNDATGEALDITGQGNGLMKFAVKAEEPPQASDPKTKLASDSKTRRTSPVRIARVEFEGKIIESMDVIGLDQKLDFAWSNGPGIFIQMADRGLLDDKGIEGEKPQGASKPIGPNPKDRLVITWTEEMRFYGKSKDMEHRPAAKIEFRGTSKDVRTPDGRTGLRRGVEATMTDSLVLCDSMDVYMDRTIALNKDTPNPAQPASDNTPSTDAQIAMLDSRGRNLFKDNGDLKLPGVDVVNEKRYPDNGLFKERQRIYSEHVTYDKRTGEFEAPGPGTTWLYKRKGIDPKNPKKLPPIELTKVKYADGMQGRFGVAKNQVADNQPREAVFVGSVESADAIVGHKNSDIDFDRPNLKDYVFLSSDNLHVFSYPPADPKDSARSLLNARGNAAARTTDSLIQADLITYDSKTELTYAYGLDGKEVSLAKQDAPGQPASTTRGKTLRYNKLTRESDFKDPQAITFTDLKTGIRPKSAFPDLGGTAPKPDPLKPQRTTMPKQSRGSTERKSAANNGT